METSKYAVLIAPFVGWFLAQLLKLVFTLRKDGISFGDAVQSGGMPSSHSAFMSSLTTAVGFTDGFSSSLFAVCVALTAIVMYDATGVRRTTGEQTQAIMMITGKHKSDQPLIHDARGHSPLEVVAGMVTGIVTGIITVIIM